MTPLRIIYITNARLPTEKAHGLSTMKLSEAFASAGAEVTVVAPWRWNALREDPFAYYGVKRVFRIVRLPSIDVLWMPFAKALAFALQLFSFSFVAGVWLLLHRGVIGARQRTVIFSHDHVPLFFASFIAPNIYYDVHDYPGKNIFFRRVMDRAAGIFVQTRGKVSALTRDFGIPAERIVAWPNGTDVERFRDLLPREEARMRLTIPAVGVVVLYTGSLQSWKGVDTLVRAASLLPANFRTYIIGGAPDEIASLKRLEPKAAVTFVGNRPWREMPLWLAAADILVLPNTGREEISRSWTSPMKLFEYMASGRPMIASDIPSIREILDGSSAFLATPDDSRSFATAIVEAANDLEDATKRAFRAQNVGARYTWSARAGAILGRLDKLT